MAVITCNNTTELPNVRIRNNDVIHLLDYAPGHSGGGGYLSYDQASTAPVDNGIVFDGPESRGRYLRNWDRTSLDVTWWGADPSNGFESSAIFKMVFDLAKLTGIPVLIPHGEYNLTSWTKYTTTTGNNLKLIGEGEVLLNGPGNTHNTDPLRFIEQLGGKLSFRGINFTNFATVMWSPATGINEDCDFEAWHCKVYSCSEGFNRDNADLPTTRFVVQHCEFWDLQSGACNDKSAVKLADVGHNYIHDCTVTGIGSFFHGIMIGSTDTGNLVQTSTVHNNVIRDIQTQAAGCYPIITYGENSHIYANTIERCWTTTVGAEFEVCYGIYSKAVNSQVVNNSIKDSGGSDGMIVCKDGGNVVISGNTLRATLNDRLWEAIRAQGNDSKVVNNIIAGENGARLEAGIYMTGGNDVDASGNKIIGWEGSDTDVRGIWIGNYRRIKICNNVIDDIGNTTGGARTEYIRCGANVDQKEVVIDNNHLLNPKAGGSVICALYLNHTSGANCDVTFRGNTVDGAFSRGIDSAGAADASVKRVVRILNNEFRNLVGISDVRGIYLWRYTHHYIDGNRFEDINTATGSSYCCWVPTDNTVPCERLSFQNNECRNITAAGEARGILWESGASSTTKNVTVRFNTFDNVANQAIRSLNINNIDGPMIVSDNVGFETTVTFIHFSGTPNANASVYSNIYNGTWYTGQDTNKPYA